MSRSLASTAVERAKHFQKSATSSPKEHGANTTSGSSMERKIFSIISSESSRKPGPGFCAIKLISGAGSAVSVAYSRSRSSSVSVLCGFKSTARDF